MMIVVEATVSETENVMDVPDSGKIKLTFREPRPLQYLHGMSQWTSCTGKIHVIIPRTCWSGIKPPQKYKRSLSETPGYDRRGV